MAIRPSQANQARQWALGAKPMRLADFEALNVPPPPLDGGLPPGEEAFGRPASPWSQLSLGAPLAGVGLLIARAVAPVGLLPNWVLERGAELGAFLLMPFVACALAQSLAGRVADAARAKGRGFDPSARAWHPALALAILAAPWVALCLWPAGQEAFLTAWLRLELALGADGVVGYGFGPLNLALLLPAFAWVGLGGRAWARALPPGRLKGLLAEVKAALVGKEAAPQRAEAVAALLPAWLPEAFAPTEELARLRGEALQRDLIVALSAEGGPDLARANQAVAAYRLGL